MNSIRRIDSFIKLGQRLDQMSEDELKRLTVNAQAKNNWFTEDNVRFALEQIKNMLSETNLRTFADRYDLENHNPKTIGLVSAGNIPLVGFHDFMCILLSGHHAMVKLSSEDDYLPREIIKLLLDINPDIETHIELVDRIEDAEAYIATGSNNTSRYFEYYFSKRPNIIRKNRTSVGILNGKETPTDLEAIGEDVFRYFGLGCRNISKIFVPKGYKFDPLFEAIYPWSDVIHNNKYNNNYSYNNSVYLVAQKPFLDNNFFMIKEDEDLHSPVGVLYYEEYDNPGELDMKINALTKEERLQCVASADGWYKDSYAFGTLQKPDISDFADGVDTMQFLTEL